MQILGIVFLVVALVAPISAQAKESFEQLWRESMPLMTKGMDIIAQGKDPNKRSVTEILTFRDSKFQRIVNECFQILADSETLDLLAKRNRLSKKMAQRQKDIVELQKEMFSAPEEHWNPLAKTKSRITQLIKEYRAEIAACEQQIAALTEQAVQTINVRGVPISKDQVEALLSAADGEDTASIMAVAENVKLIHGKIEELVKAPDSSVELLKTYTGIYMMCHKVYSYAIEHALEQITTVYLKRLGDFRKEASGLLDSAKAMLREASEADRKILAANIATNQRTLEVIQLYNQYLRSQQRNLESLHRRAEKSANVAVNTYRTVKTGAELLRMIKSTEGEFAQIFSFEPPNVQLLYDERFRSEFEQITTKLRVE